MSRKKLSRIERRFSRAERLRPLAGLLAVGLSAPALAGPSVPFPTYQTGPQADGSWVVSSGQIINPAGIQVDLGIRVRAKAIAVNPNHASHTAAVLTMGAQQAVEVFSTITGEVLQTYLPFEDSSGSYSGITYSADGKYLMFSQDSSNVTFATVDPSTGVLSDYAHVNVPPDASFIQCFPDSPTGSYGVPCGTFYSPGTAYPGGVAFSEDGKSAYALLNQNNTLAQINLATKTQGAQVRVGNAPHSIVIKQNTAYVSNEGGRVATGGDFQIWSAGTPIVADMENGSAVTGTVSVVNLNTMQVVSTIPVGLHPTGMALFGDALLVANTYSDSISVVDTATNIVMRTIDLGLPISVPGQDSPAYGAAPNSIAVDPSKGIAYVALYNANAVAVVDLSGGTKTPVMGLIPVAYAPASVVLDKAENKLIVANDKGIGARFSFETDYGVTDYNTHQDNGTVSIVPVPDAGTLATMTKNVYQYNHWDLKQSIDSAGGGSPSKLPIAIPDKIGDPSLIKHVFLIVRENRTYDQMLGDVTKGSGPNAANGDPTLAVFGCGAAAGPQCVTPNAHQLVTRFPLFDNFYDPSRQSADGHQWIMEAMAPYADDIQSPDWVRSYPGGNAGDALAYQRRGFLFQEAADAGLSVKIYGEYVETDYCAQPQTPANVCGNTPGNEPSWSQFYADAQNFEAGGETTLKYQNAITAVSSIPAVSDHLIKNFPQFDLGIPDQWRVDLWVQDFQNDVRAGTVPALSILWIMCDHTGGPPTVRAEQADNDLAVGRIIDYISHSNVWASSAIFIEEDDAQNGVDHVDGHRSPGYVVSPYAVQNAPGTDHTYYTQVNMTRTIEQILGLPPMNQFDLVASPMRTAFVTGTPPDANFAPWTHVPNIIPLNQGVPTSAAKQPLTKLARAGKKTKQHDNIALDQGVPTSAAKEPLTKLARAWKKMKQQMFAGKLQKPDSVDVETHSHLDWYEATNFKRPYPGEKKVLWPSAFASRLGMPKTDLDD